MAAQLDTYGMDELIPLEPTAPPARPVARTPEPAKPAFRTWEEIAGDPEYKTLSSDDQETVRQRFFEQVVAPEFDDQELDTLRKDFDRKTRPGKVRQVAHDAGRVVGGAAMAAKGILDRAADAAGPTIDAGLQAIQPPPVRQLSPETTPGYRGRRRADLDRQTFIESVTPYAEAASKRTGVPADILIAHAAQETGWGRSVHDNNYFNITGSFQGKTRTRGDSDASGKAIQQSFRVYDDPQQSFDDLADLIARRYPQALGATDAKTYGQALKAGGYAADPAYADHIADRHRELTGGAAPRDVRPSTAIEQPYSLRHGGAEGLKQFLQSGKDESHLRGMQPEFADRLAGMLEAAPPEIRAQVGIMSGYRSHERQAELWRQALQKYGSPAAARKWVAPPGHSNHNKGMAADLTYASPEAKAWVHQHAGEHGLNFRMGNEPWHIELAPQAARGYADSEGRAMPQELYGLPLQKGYIDTVRAKWDAAGPGERARMLTSDSEAEARVARFLRDGYAQADRFNDPVLSLLDGRREKREEAYRFSGADPESARRWADTDLKLGIDRRKDEALSRSMRPGYFDMLADEFKRGLINLGANAGDQAAFGLDVVGADQAAKGLLESMKLMKAEAEELAGPVQDFAQINTDQPKYLLDDATRYVGSMILSNLPMMLPSIGTGVLGGVVAQKAAQTAAKALVESVGPEAAAKYVMAKVAQGAAIGAGASAVGLETGSIYGDIYGETGQMRPGVAAAGGVLAGALDAIPAWRAATKLIGAAAASQVAGTVLKRLGREAGIQFLAEGGTEFVQTLIERGAVHVVDGTPLVNEADVHEAINAAVAGGLTGGAMGGLSQGAAELRRPPSKAGALASELQAAIDKAKLPMADANTGDTITDGQAATRRMDPFSQGQPWEAPKTAAPEPWASQARRMAAGGVKSAAERDRAASTRIAFGDQPMDGQAAGSAWPSPMAARVAGAEWPEPKRAEQNREVNDGGNQDESAGADVPGTVARAPAVEGTDTGTGGGAGQARRGVVSGGTGRNVESGADTAGQGAGVVESGGALGAEEPAKNTFDKNAFDDAYDQRVKASKAAGRTHLDDLPAYVETMRGKSVYYLHDPKVTGKVRTVDQNGNVYIDWTDEYSAKKELASPSIEKGKTVYRTSLGPSDLKDYVVGKPDTLKEKAPEAKAEAEAGSRDDAETDFGITEQAEKPPENQRQRVTVAREPVEGHPEFERTVDTGFVSITKAAKQANQASLPPRKDPDNIGYIKGSWERWTPEERAQMLRFAGYGTQDGRLSKVAEAAVRTEKGWQLSPAVHKRMFDAWVAGQSYAQTKQLEALNRQAREPRLRAEVQQMVDAKAVAALRERLGNLDNVTSRQLFTEMTGVDLPKTKAATLAALDAWADISAEERARLDAEREADFEAKGDQSDLEWAASIVEHQTIGGPDKTQKGALDRVMREGYTELFVWPGGGAVPRYGLRNPATGLSFRLFGPKWPKGWAAAARRYVELSLKVRGLAPDREEEVVKPGQVLATDEDVKHLLGGEKAEEKASAPEPVAEGKASPDAEAMADLKAQMGQAIGELASILGAKSNLTEEEESRIIPVMSKIFRIAAKMGYLQFKEAGRYVMQQIRELAGDEIANKLSIDNLHAGYINIASEIGGDKRAALAIESIEELERAEAAETQAATTEESSAVEAPPVVNPWDAIAARGEAWREDRWFGTRVEVAPGMKGDTGWTGTVQEVRRTSAGEPWLEIKKDGNDFSVRVKPERVTVLELQDSEVASEKPSVPIEPAESPVSQGKPAPGAYRPPANVSGVAGQQALSQRGMRLASLSMLNERVTESNPEAAYTPDEIENAADDRIDAMQDWLIDQQRQMKPDEALDGAGKVDDTQAVGAEQVGPLAVEPPDANDKHGRYKVKNAEQHLWAVFQVSPAGVPKVEYHNLAKLDDDSGNPYREVVDKAIHEYLAAAGTLTPKKRRVSKQQTGKNHVTDGNSQRGGVSGRDSGGAEPGAIQNQAADSEPVDAGVAGAGAGTDQNGSVPVGAGGAVSSGTGRPGGQRGPDTGGTREGGTGGAVAGVSATEGLTDDGGIDAEDIGKGGLGKKYRDNVAAIRILKTLATEGRAATVDERKALARYVGWGAMKGVFDPANKTWAKQHQELKSLLTPEEWAAAMASTRNAHYTSPAVVQAMYQAVERLGFQGGFVLEPSVGSGNFFGLMPKGLRGASKLHGVELDVLTSQLAQALYPQAVIAGATGFQDYAVPADYFDLTIGNPPFGNESITERTTTGRTAPYSGQSIHNYFLARMIDKTRPGGLMAVVVSHSFMDVATNPARDWIAERANLLGAVRLPNTAFKNNAGTEVVTDILIFQKTEPGQAEAATWADTQEIEVLNAEGEPIATRVSQYFIDHPERVLGTQSAKGTMYRADSYTVDPVADWEKTLKDFAATLPEGVYTPVERAAEELDAADHAIPDGVKENSFYVTPGGEIRQRDMDLAGQKRSKPWLPPNGKARERMTGMIRLRELLRAQLRLERDPMASQQAIEANRGQLRDAYRAFQKAHGFVNNQTNRRLFADDTESALVQALEFDYDKGVSATVAAKEGREAQPERATEADILSRRVLFPPQEAMNVSSAQDALLASMNLKGTLDLDYMARVYGQPEATIIRELGDLIYQDPLTEQWQMADEYLSGDVKTKLVNARQAVEAGGDYRRNVAALEPVIPKDKLPSEIFVSLGAAWVPNDVVAAFATEISGMETGVSVAWVPEVARWVTSFNGTSRRELSREKFGTSRLSATDLLGLLLNSKPVEVKDWDDVNKRSVINESKTEEAKAKAEAIREHWDQWIFSDPKRAGRLTDIYNDRFNRSIDRAFNGAHLTLPGSTPVITLNKHQKDAIWRGIQERNVLLDHVVGAGKTFAVTATVMEWRRLGIARKPLIVVPNHLTQQWRSEFSRLYPGSNVLAAEPADFNKDNRERLFAKIATGDWDAVVVGHSSLKKLGLSPEVESHFLREQVSEITAAIEALKRERGDKRIIADMEKIKINLQSKINDLLNKAGSRDKVLYFDELGIDALVVDEHHEFKNLFFTTQKQRIAGLGNPKGSGKAFDLFMKVRWLQDTFGERAPLITATGTPISNSLAEMFTMQRYMRYANLKREGLHLFDAWASVYGLDRYVYEVKPSGVGYRFSLVFDRFKNLPSLVTEYRTFADTISLSDLKANAAAEGKRFPVPNMVGGKPQNIVAPRSALQKEYFGYPRLVRDEAGVIQYEMHNPTLATIEKNQEGKFVLKDRLQQQTFDTEEEARLALVTKALTPMTSVDPHSLVGQFENLKALMRSSKGKINALSLTGLASKAGLDMRLIDRTAPDFPDSKINLAVKEMMRLYRAWDADKGTQLVFCDLSVPLSARAHAAVEARKVFVRDENKDITHKKGTLHTLEGREGMPFYLVAEGKGDQKGYVVYDAVSGVKASNTVFKDKKAALEMVRAAFDKEAGRDWWFALRDDPGAIDQGDIDEYKDRLDWETDPDAEISLEDLEGMASSARFSVYDDIKAKLIKAGVPEHEIAFIHDFHTPKKKAELFGRVKSGQVRFLLGSTPKLGAGTNVQDRLVGLHHIDAPWRPSDLEQREGRILRQGNKLYERDPDGFEVFIGRYATEQTNDTRRWQILERKAGGIEQLRHYSGELEIEDVASEASNAADMKAAASGNPLILEETQLRAEVRKREALRKAHQDGQLQAQTLLYFNEHAINESLPQRIAEIQAVIDIAEAHPRPADKELVADLAVDGKPVRERKAALAALEKLWAKLVKLHHNNESINARVQYRGLKFTFKSGGHDNVYVTGPDNYSLVSYSTDADKKEFSASGFLTRLNNYIDALPAKVADIEADRAQKQRALPKLRERAQAPYPDLEQLKDAQARHADVSRRLARSSVLEAIQPEEKAAFLAEQAGRMRWLRSLGYRDAVREFAGKDLEEPAEAPRTARVGVSGPDTRVKQGKAGVRAEREEAVKLSRKPTERTAQGYTPASVRAAIDASEGTGFAAALEKTGWFHIITGDQVPEDVRAQAGGDRVPAYTWKGEVYFVADEIHAGDSIPGLLRHEVAVHAMQLGKSEAEFRAILQAMRRLPGEKAARARAAVPQQTPGHLRDEEALAYFIEQNPTHSLTRRFLAWLRSAIRALARRLPGVERLRVVRWANTLSEDDLIAMANSALRSAVRGDGALTGEELAKFTFGGERAATADKFALESARARLEAGEDAEQVRQETGWFQGKDGKWRFEINDADARFQPRAMSKLWDGALLGEVIDHPALFAAYPTLAKLRVRLQDKKGAAFDGKTITVYGGLGATEERMLSDILHEIQHGLQDIEGFASGGNPDTALPTLIRSINRPVLETNDEYQQLLFDEAVGDLTAQSKQRLQELRDLRQSVDGEIERVKADQDADYKAYRRLYGEVEARNVQARQGFSDAQRRATPISATQDVPDSDVIVSFNGKDMASAPRPANAGLPETITVEGVERPTRNSEGRVIHPTEEGVRNFWRTFKNTDAVDKQGRPLVLYHGTPSNVESFDAEKTGGLINLTTQPWIADQYAIGEGGNRSHGDRYFVDHETGEIFEPDNVGTALYIDWWKGSNGTSLSTYDLRNGMETGRYEEMKSGANTMPLYANVKLLDLLTPEGRKVLAGLDHKNNRWAAPVVEAAQRGDFHWQDTKNEWSLKVWRDILNPQLEALGYTGIKFWDDNFGDPFTIAVFRNTQLKSAIGNTGAFSPTNPDIRFSRRPSEPKAPHQRIYSAADPVGVAEKELQQIDAAVAGAGGWGAALKRLDGRGEDSFRKLGAKARREILGALTVHQLVDVGGSVLPRMREYLTEMSAMDATRNRLIHDSDALAKRWGALPKKEIARVGYVMHESTIAGVDGSDKEYIPSIDIKEAKQKIKTLQARQFGAGGDKQIAQWQAEVNELKARIQFELNRRKEWHRVKGLYEALSTEGQAVYRAVRDYHCDHLNRVQDALVQMIEKTRMTGKQKYAAIQQLKEEFELLRVQAPYFPLGRFGDYWVHVAEETDPRTGNVIRERIFEKFETREEADAFYQEQVTAGRQVARGKQLENLREVTGVSATFVAQVEDLIGELGAENPEVADLRDQVYQLYLKTLPEVSSRKHAIHRGKVAGYAKDALRVFANKAFHDAYQYARIKHGFELREVMEQLQADVAAAGSAAKVAEMAARRALLEGFRDEVLAKKLTFRATKERAVVLDAQAAEIIASAKKRRLTEGEQFVIDEAARWNQYAAWFGEWHKKRKPKAMEIKRMTEAQLERELSALDLREQTIAAIQAHPTGHEFAPDLLNELQKAYQWLMNPTTGRVASMLNALGFGFHLAVSPAAWVTNATQTPLIAMPYVAATRGLVKTHKAFQTALGEAMRSSWRWNPHKEHRFGIREALIKQDEIDAYNQALDRGLVDRGRVMDLIGLAEEGADRLGGWQKFGTLMALGFHEAERVNREVTFMAAYRLARDAGESFMDAVDYADKVVNETHFNYTAENRARWMRSDAARVLLQFKSYAQHVTYLQWKMVRAALGQAPTPEAKAAARKFLMVQTAVQLAAGGVMGLPLGVWATMGAVAPGLAAAKRWGYKGALLYTFALMGAAVGLGGDDPDDPVDWWAEFEQAMADAFGATGGQAVGRGLVNAVGGIDLSSRVSMRELWWREIGKDIEERSFVSDVLTQAAGPSIGVLVDIGEGVTLAAQGQTYRGIERMVPKMIRDGMQAARFFDEGALTLKGDPLIEELTPFEILARASGFTPSRLTARYAENQAEKQRESRIESRRQRVQQDIAEAGLARRKAEAAGEEEQAAEASDRLTAALERAKRYNQKQPQYPITPDSLSRSVKGRLRARLLAKDGVFMNRRIPERYEFAPKE